MSAPAHADAMELAEFFPYRLAVLAETVSRSMAGIYATRFDLSRDEWRVLAALVGHPPLRTAEVIERTTLDKVSTSRALARLEAKALVEREPDPADGRAYVIRLRPAGRALYRKIVPLVREREQFLLEGLSETERRTLNAAMDTLRERALTLNRGTPARKITKAIAER